MTVISGDKENGTLIELLAKCDSDYLYINRIYISTPAFPAGYTELNSTSYFITKAWGRNATFTVGWYERTEISTSALTYDSSSWLNYTIYFEGSPVGWGTWSQSGSSWIQTPVGIHFLVTVDTDYWPLPVSDTAYQIVISAHTDGNLDPTSITIYLTVTPAVTSQGVGTDHIVEYFGTHNEHTYWMNDVTNGGYVHGLNVYSYAIKIGTVIQSQGTLIDNLDGTYSLPASALHGYGVGTYLIAITLQKANYFNQSIIVDATINPLPMDLLIFTPDDYVWSLGTEYLYFQYQIDWNNTATTLDIHI
jgi:hypothetical protein